MSDDDELEVSMTLALVDDATSMVYFVRNQGHERIIDGRTLSGSRRGRQCSLYRGHS